MNTSTKDAVKLESCEISIIDGKIIYQKYYPISGPSKRNAKEIAEKVNEIATKTPEGTKLMLSSTADLLSMKPEIRKYFAEYPTNYNWKIAMFSDNSMSKIINSLLASDISSRFETKCFSDYQKAIDWLKLS